ncbi:MAG: carbon-nitrogen hydrolase [Nitrospinae bacterium RIFCSPLOWO2_12_FULL_45_22]|nr:MAG: carbon-nitrogen hydrolase [Nitrospinae bacterium RIFCSPLOWO2_12_FULL_45_22]
MILKVGLGQINPALGNLSRNIAIYEELFTLAKAQAVDLLIFPELGLTGYFLRDMVPEVALREESAILTRLKDMSREIPIATGFVEESKEHLFYNAGIYLEDGEVRHIHRKVYLPTYGMFDEQRYFARGKMVRAFDSKFGRAALLICEDLWHPSTAYIAFQDGADFLLVLSSSPGRGVDLGEKLVISDTWETLNKTYAKLFSQFIFFANRVGYEDGINFWGGSEIITPEGQQVAKGRYFQEELVVGEIDTNDIRRTRISTTLLRDEDLDLTLRELLRIHQKKFA